MPKIATLKKRALFLRLSREGRKIVTHTVIVQQLPAPVSCEQAEVGFTVTKKLGGAVIRNRIKRRLKAAVREVFPAAAQAGSHYALIARKEALTCEYAILLRDLRYAVRKLRTQTEN